MPENTVYITNPENCSIEFEDNRSNAFNTSHLDVDVRSDRKTHYVSVDIINVEFYLNRPSGTGPLNEDIF